MGTWRGSMVAALAAALGRPDWWAMALAGFLIRGGILIVLLPLVELPSLAALTAAFSPAVSALAFGGLSTSVLMTLTAIILVAGGLLAGAGLAGAWLDLEQLRRAAADEDLELHWAPERSSLREALAMRVAAHVPTLAACAYATFRLIGAAYDELLAPGDAGLPLALRVVARAPETVILVSLTWLAGEAIGGLAARAAAAGARFSGALVTATRQVLRWRGLATLGITTVGVLAALAPFPVVVGSAWQQLRDELLGDANPILVGAALLVLVSAWTLALAILGAALAWRNAAWTAEALPVRAPASEGALIVAEA